jgi:hypothetical protein
MDESADDPIAALEEVPARIRRVRTQRLLGLGLVIALCAAAVAVPLALRDPSKTTKHRHATRPVRTKQATDDHNALNAVASALEETTATGSFRVAYTLAETPATATTDCVRNFVAEQTPVESGDGSVAFPPHGTPDTTCFYQAHDVKTTGVAIVNVNPFAMVALSNVSNFGDVTVRVDDTNVWETGGADYGLVPGAGDQGSGSSLSGFASIVEGTLGRREGAEAMMGLSSPTGYLSITREAVSDASRIGTGEVDGVPVTVYRVTVDPTLLARVAGLSPEEKQTILAALDVLKAEGFAGNTTEVSIDGAGLVRHTKSVNMFSDGGSVSSEDTFSDFGCAGVVQLPGRPVTTTPTPACAGTATTTTPTTTTEPVATTTAGASTTTTAPTTSTTTLTTSTTTKLATTTTTIPVGPSTTTPDSQP